VVDTPSKTGDLAFYTALAFLLNRVPLQQRITQGLLAQLVAEAIDLATLIRAEEQRQSGDVPSGEHE
jgi:hypothetical protein